MSGYHALARRSPSPAKRPQTSLGAYPSETVPATSPASTSSNLRLIPVEPSFDEKHPILATLFGVVGAIAGYRYFPAHPILGALSLGHLGYNTPGVLVGDRGSLIEAASGVGGILGVREWTTHPIRGYVLGGLGGRLAGHLIFHG